MTPALLSLALLGASLVGPVPAEGPLGTAADPPAGFDRDEARSAVLEVTRALVALDTSGGNELVVARWIEAHFATEPAVEVEVLPVAEGRANTLVRLRADRPSAGPLLLLAHADVAPAVPERWATPPFEATLREGTLRGRGVLDDKGPLAAQLVALRQLCGSRGELVRDVLLVVVAGEETAEPLGLERLLEERPELLEGVEFALGYGGRSERVEGGVRALEVALEEKPYLVVRAEVATRGGHAAAPHGENALEVLCRAAARVSEWSPPVQLGPTAREFFASRARLEPEGERREAMLALAEGDEQEARRAAGYLCEVPEYAASLRAVVQLTRLQAGERVNVVPDLARATYNVRLVPGQSAEALLEELASVGGEPRVRWSLERPARPAAPASTTESVLYEAVERALLALEPRAALVPRLSSVSTQGDLLRARGIPTYGLRPLPLTVAEEASIHGADERVDPEALVWAAELLYRACSFAATTAY